MATKITRTAYITFTRYFCVTSFTRPQTQTENKFARLKRFLNRRDAYQLIIDEKFSVKWILMVVAF